MHLKVTTQLSGSKAVSLRNIARGAAIEVEPVCSTAQGNMLAN